MSNSFVGTPCRAFKQSACRARVTRTGYPLLWQTLDSRRVRHNTDGTPFGEHFWQDKGINFPDPRGATFLPTTARLTGQGSLDEGWNVHIHPYPEPNDPFLQRDGQGGAFFPVHNHPGWDLQAGINLIHYSHLVAQKAGCNMLPGTDINGQTYEANIWGDRIQRLILYGLIKGTATYHTIYYGPAFTDGTIFLSDLQPTITLPSPHRIEEKHPGTVSKIEPDEPQYSSLDWDTNPPNNSTGGTYELLVFWFDLTPSDLPTFPTQFTF